MRGCGKKSMSSRFLGLLALVGILPASQSQAYNLTRSIAWILFSAGPKNIQATLKTFADFFIG